MIPMKRLNPHKLVIPARVKASAGAVHLSDLGITIGQEAVNLFEKFPQYRVYNSPTVKNAIQTGLLIAAERIDAPKVEQKQEEKVQQPVEVPVSTAPVEKDDDDIEPIAEVPEQKKKKKL